MLPTGESSFRIVCEEECLYIDKTKYIYGLIKSFRYVFLARPRRFGKSLLVSTLKEIFLGNKELFTNLWIGKESDYEWPEHPVIHIDFNSIYKSGPQILEMSLCRFLDKVARLYKIDLSLVPHSGEKLIELIETLSGRHGKVVLLIDEYDAAILDMLPNKELAEANRAILRGFYGVIKTLGQHLRFLLVTGVSKCTKVSLFSDFNNLSDISFDSQMAALLGYTKEEIKSYFLPYVDEVALYRGLSRDEVLTEMREWYNGYRFSDAEIRVYNPWSILRYLSSKRRANYWFASGTPTFLVALLKANSHYALSDLENISASEEDLDAFEIGYVSPVALLYQSGYLTIMGYDKVTGRYQLGYPNKEVESSWVNYFCFRT